MKEYDKGTLKKPPAVYSAKNPAVRSRSSLYDPFANELIQQLNESSSSNHRQWLKDNALQIATKYLHGQDLEEFKASDKWIHSVLTKSGLVFHDSSSSCSSSSRSSSIPTADVSIPVVDDDIVVASSCSSKADCPRFYDRFPLGRL